MGSGLLPLTLPAWYRAFAPIQVPWEDVKPDDLPDILDLVRANAARAPDLGWGKGSGDGQGDGDGSGTGPGTGAGTGGGSGAGSGTGSGANTGSGTGGWTPGAGPVPRNPSTGQIDWGAIVGILGLPTYGWDPQDPTSDFPASYPVRPGSPPPPYEPTPGSYSLEGNYGLAGDPSEWDDAQWDEWARRRQEFYRWLEENRDPSFRGGGIGISAPDSGGGGSGGGGSTGEQPTEYAQFPGLGGIDIPPYPLPPGPSDFEPDYGSILGGILGLGDLISGGGFGGAIGQGIPQIMPGDLPIPGGQATRGLGDFGGTLARIGAVGDILNLRDDPRGAFNGVATLANPAVGALAGGYLALADVLNNMNASARQEARDYYNQVGAAYVDQILPQFWAEMGRNSDWIYGPRMGTGQSDADFVRGWQGWLASSGVGGRPETPFQNFGKLSPEQAAPAITQSLYDYLATLDTPLERGMGPGDFAPKVQLDRLYGTQDQSRYYDLNSLGFDGLELAMSTLPNRIDAAWGLANDPSWQQWAAEFSQLRPDVPLPQANSYIDPRLVDYWGWVESNRRNMGMSG